MPRKLLVRSDQFPYHVTNRGNNRERFPLKLDTMWDLLQSECWALRLDTGARFHGLTLMPNHVHMLVTTPELDLGIVMNLLNSRMTKKVNALTGRSGHLFQGPYHWTQILSSRYFGHALKYVYRNPVKAGLCERTEDYPFSTLSETMGNAPIRLPLSYTRPGMEVGLPMDEPLEFLKWLNRPFPKEAEELIQLGLRKKVFEDIKNLKIRKPPRILERLI